jgi:hypothetical protein
MSILAEIAANADVPVEDVIRVLTREPVSEAVQERVLAVLGDLDPEQTRAVQRFALAALHDVLERPAERTAEAAAALRPAVSPPPAPGTPDAALAELGSVLAELAEAIRDLRSETDTERRERVDDLAVLIDLIATGWEGLDTRLGRIERQVGRLESARREPAPLPPPPPPRAALGAAEPVAPRRGRSRLPLVAALTLAAAGIVTLAVLQLASGRPDLAQLVEARADSTPTTQPTTTRARSSRPPSAPPPARATTSSEADTTAPRTEQDQPATTAAPPAATTAAPATTAPPTTTGAAAPGSPAGFQPTRNWAWAPVAAADYYSVEFSRGGKSIYRATTTEPFLSLPSSIVFRPGSYRWVVLPGYGPRSESRYGAPVVDSGFTVS